MDDFQFLTHCFTLTTRQCVEYLTPLAWELKKTKNSNSFKVWVIDKEKESLILVAGGGSGGENGRAPITEKALQMIDINFGKNGVQTVYTDTPKNVYCAGAGVENTRKRGLRQGNRPPQDLLSFQNYQSFKKVIYHIS